MTDQPSEQDERPAQRYAVPTDELYGEEFMAESLEAAQQWDPRIWRRR